MMYSFLYVLLNYRGVAQLVERLVRDQEAVRSNRIAPTKAFVKKASFCRGCSKTSNALTVKSYYAIMNRKELIL